jgi:carboxyl-terminal processing protease
MTLANLVPRVAALLLLIIFLLVPAQAQKISSYERDRAQAMLHVIADDVKKHYYDPKFHGVNWDAKVHEISQKIEHAETSNGALSEIAALLDSLNDSHTFFVPPQHAAHYEYGWVAQLIGNRCYIVQVRADSDAESKGVKPGDENLSLSGYQPTKENFWKMQYVLHTLRPQASLRLELRDPSGKQRTVDVLAKVTESRHVQEFVSDVNQWLREGDNSAHQGRPRTAEIGEELMVLKFPGFSFDESEVDLLVSKARKHKSLILDLRNNGGGSEDTLKSLLGRMFDQDVKIGDRAGRNERKPVIAKSHRSPFNGKLIVLVDSGSASASELFARVVQLEKRGLVLGDTSSGKVMEAEAFSHQVGLSIIAFYGDSITRSDVIMTDGKSLENLGVTPDETSLPTAADLAAGRDPVLARAAELAGVRLTPEAAGKLFPYEWPRRPE